MKESQRASLRRALSLVRRPSSSVRSSRSRSSRSASPARLSEIATCQAGTDEAGTPPRLARVSARARVRVCSSRARSNRRGASRHGRNQCGASQREASHPGKTAGVRITAARTRLRRIPGAWTRLARITAVTTSAVRTLPVMTSLEGISPGPTWLVGTRGARAIPLSPIRRRHRWRRCRPTASIASMPPGRIRRCRTSSAQGGPHAPPRAPPRPRRAPKGQRQASAPRDRGPSGLRTPWGPGGRRDRVCPVPVCLVPASRGTLGMVAESKDLVALRIAVARGTLRPGAR